MSRHHSKPPIRIEVDSLGGAPAVLAGGFLLVATDQGGSAAAQAAGDLVDALNGQKSVRRNPVRNRTVTKSTAKGLRSR